MGPKTEENPQSVELVVGSIFWTDESRRKVQKRQVAEAVRQLRKTYKISQVSANFQRDARSKPVRIKNLKSMWKILLSQESLLDREMCRRNRSPTRARITLFADVARSVLTLASDARWHERNHRVGELSLKHLHIWSSVLNSRAEGAVIFEDDFLVSSDSSHLQMSQLIEKYIGRADLIDLAGGFPRRAIGLPPNPGEDIHLDFIVSNTTCAYFISRKACESLFDLVHSDPTAIYLGSDWLLNSLNDKLLDASSVHPWRLPYVHGSIQGLVPSLLS